MKSASAFLLLLVFYGSIAAQTPMWLNSERSWAVATSGTAYYDANALSNKFVNSLYYGGFIDAGLKDKQLARTKDKNRFGAEASWAVEVYHLQGIKIKETRLPWKLHLSDHLYGNGKYTGDLYSLGFYGNARFEDDTAMLSPLSVNLLRLQQVGLSWVSPKKMHEVGLTYVNGHSGTFLDAEKLSLFTADQGLYLDLEAKGSLATLSNNNYLGSRGSGVALNFRLNEVFTISKKVTFSIMGDNIGLMWWRSAESYAVDTSIHFDGIEITDLLNYQTDSINLLDSLLPDKSDSSFRKMLPGNIQYTFQIPIGEKFTVKFGSQYILNANFKMRYFLGTTFAISDQFRTELLLSHGGYGTFRVGVEVHALWQKSLYLKVGLPNVIGLISGNVSGMGANLKVVKLF